MSYSGDMEPREITFRPEKERTWIQLSSPCPFPALHVSPRFLRRQTNLEPIVRSEISHKEKDKYSDFTYV